MIPGMARAGSFNRSPAAGVCPASPRCATANTFRALVAVTVLAMAGVAPSFAAATTAMTAIAATARAEPLAASPPMGWNSWDAYGLTINEEQFKANAAVLASLERYGWKYAVIDEGWYMRNPFGRDRIAREYVLDAHGLLIPAPSRFPSAAGGHGFKPLADWLHARGLAFGLHVVRGIPRQAVLENLPIAGSPFHARDAADTADTCPWDDGNYGVADNAAGQAYYDSMLRQYSDWGLDFIKMDCVADHPYKPREIHQIAAAIQSTGRPIVLSLSPGPTQLAHAAEVARYAQMWRIANDLWDAWTFPHARHGADFPNGLRTAFDNLAKWAAYVERGHWPDADMLPIGSLTPHPGWGEPRESRLSHAEERTALTLWAVARSPLILGANLTRLDDFTRSLITNGEVLDIDQTARSSRPVTDLPPRLNGVRVWIALISQHGRRVPVVALFNLGDDPRTLHATWRELGGIPGRRRARELWSGRTLVSDRIDVTLPGHGCAIYRLE